MAQSAAGLPFQLPVAPVAGFNPFQNQAFGQVQGMQGMAQPYFNAASGYMANSAAPITGADVGQYYNPMAANVTAQMQNIFGQQQAKTFGDLTQQAGGVGADRIAVGQGELANQQGLAAGQTYAGLYQQALQAAQQQKQMEAGAGYGFGQLGPAAQNAYLQGTGALGQAGLQQQQQTQAQLNAPYQNTLAQIAFPYQQAQYLAGITGGLAPAMGGTTNATTTYPTPSPLAQGLGIGTSLLGMGMMGGTGGMMGGKGSMYGGGGGGYTPQQSPIMLGNPWTGMYAGGGRISRRALGGQAKDQDDNAGFERSIRNGTSYWLDKNDAMDSDWESRFESTGGAGSNNPYYQFSPLFNPHPAPPTEHNFDASHPNWSRAFEFFKTLYGREPATDTDMESEMPRILRSLPNYDDGGAVDDPNAIKSAPFPGASIPKVGGSSPIPYIQLPMGGGHSGLMTGGINHQSPYQFNPQGGGAGNDMQKAMQFAQALGAAGGMARGGGVNPYDFGQGFAEGGLTDDSGLYNDPAYRDEFLGSIKNTYGSVIDPIAKSWSNADRPLPWSPKPAEAQTATPPPMATPTMPATAPLPMPRPDPATATAQPQLPPTAAPAAASPNTITSTAPEYMLPDSMRPYPGARDQNWGQSAARNPWMSLVKAGAAMATTVGPIGSVIGRGIQAGAGEFDSQRKDLANEEQINQKAQQLWQQAKIHLDQYARMTPYQRAHLAQMSDRLSYDKDHMAAIQSGKLSDVASVSKFITDNYPSVRAGTPEFNSLVETELGRRRQLATGQGGQQRPPSIPPEAQWSAKTQRWWTRDGNSWDANGSP